MRFLVPLALLVIAATADAQADDPLAVTLPNGKVLHFQTDDQKAKYLAARARAASPAPTSAPVSAPVAGLAQPTPPDLGHTALDDKPAMNGKVNVSAPTFTADYYLFAPETWQGKQVTVSVAYLTRGDDSAPRPDGLVRLSAQTYGTYQGNGERHAGGLMPILATTDAAQRILTLCGTHYRSDGWGTKLTLIKGQYELIDGEGTHPRQRYGLIVTQ